MIDWLTFRAPLEHRPGAGGPLWAGTFISIVPDPEQGEAIEWETLKRLPVEGSYSNRITVQSSAMPDGRPAVWVSGCPAKWFQGHNVHGTDDLPGLVLEMLHRVCSVLGIEPSQADRAAWAEGFIDLTRVDVTYSWDFGSLARAQSAIRCMALTAHMAHRGRGEFKGSTLYFGKNSQRWSLKVYPKGAELVAHPLPLDLAESSLPGHAAGLVRIELCLRSKWLRCDTHPEFGLSRVSGWCDTTAAEVHSLLLQTLNIAEATMLDTHDLDALPRHLLPVYNLWRDGHDLRTLYTRPTFYRHRAALLAHGIDIAVKQDRPQDASNVVPLRTVLVGKPAQVPDWLLGTPWYFEPRAKVA